jgi:hypothetical protein
VAGFFDKFLSTYGRLLTTLLVVLSITDNTGFAKPLHFVKKSQPARVEQWVRDEKPSMAQIESLIERVKQSSAPKP